MKQGVCTEGGRSFLPCRTPPPLPWHAVRAKLHAQPGQDTTDQLGRRSQPAPVIGKVQQMLETASGSSAASVGGASWHYRADPRLSEWDTFPLTELPRGDLNCYVRNSSRRPVSLLLASS